MKQPKTNKTFFDPADVLIQSSQRLSIDLNRDQPSLVDPRPYRFSVAAQEKNLSKKYILPQTAHDTSKKAIDLFLEVNEEMSQYRRLGTSVMEHDILRLMLTAKAIVHVVLGEVFDETTMIECAKHSSGVSVGVPFTDTSLERKFKAPISSTAMASRYFPLLETVLPEIWRAIASFNGLRPLDCLQVVVGSKLCTVPKTSVIDRTICPEPTFNMFLQQGTAAMLNSAMEQWGLSLANDQRKHRKIAWMGSVSNKMGTIDFSNASDRISIGLVDYLFPKQWSAILHDIRSPVARYKSGKEDREVSLNMISSMGNATTFPVETLVFWSMAMAAQSITDGMFPPGTAFIDIKQAMHKLKDRTHTFGDDVIIPCAAVPLFLRACTCVGLVANSDKSFFGEEFFRESCGGDYFHGRDVRPLYIKGPPETMRRLDNEAWLYRTINQVLTKYKTYFGPVTYMYDKLYLAYLFNLLKLVTGRIKFVPEHYPQDSGITSILDSQRIIYHYSLERHVSRVGLDRNGSLDFTYLRFQYARKSFWYGDIRYAVHLQINHEDNPKADFDPAWQQFQSWFPLPVLATEEQNGRLRMLGQYVQSRVNKDDRPHGYHYAAMLRDSPWYDHPLSVRKGRR